MSDRVLLLGLDYELFFGSQPGSVQKCMLEPTQELVNLVHGLGCRITFFVDAGCLLALRQNNSTYPDYQLVHHQLRNLVKSGHDVQLHIHPHWEDSHWKQESNSWYFDTSRYRLHDFTPSERTEIAVKYNDVLEEIVGYRPTVYRAGGWCLQPFDGIATALSTAGISVDSTVYFGGYSTDPGREYNFLEVQDEGVWRFSEDPAIKCDQGYFLEIPISTTVVPWHFHWLDQMRSRLSKNLNTKFGDGQYMAHGMGYLWKRLTQNSLAPASIDGGKARILPDVRDQDFINVMGHPKSLTRASLESLKSYIQKHEFDCLTIRNFASTK